MTIQQLEYILAVDQFRHFARAAEYCRVTQPTLCMRLPMFRNCLSRF